MPSITITVGDQTILDDLVIAFCARGNYQPTLPDPSWTPRVPDPNWPPTVPDQNWQTKVPGPGGVLIDNPTPRANIPNAAVRVTVANPVQPQPKIPNPQTAAQFAEAAILAHVLGVSRDHKKAVAANAAAAAALAAHEAQVAAGGIALTVIGPVRAP